MLSGLKRTPFSDIPGHASVLYTVGLLAVAARSTGAVAPRPRLSASLGDIRNSTGGRSGERGLPPVITSSTLSVYGPPSSSSAPSRAGWIRYQSMDASAGRPPAALVARIRPRLSSASPNSLGGLADGHHPPLYFEAPAVILILVLVGQVLELSARDQRGAALTFVAGLVLGSAPSRTTRRERGTR